MSARTFLLALMLMVPMLLGPMFDPPKAEANIFTDGWHALTGWTKKMTKKVESAVKHGVHELSRLSGDVYKFAKKKLEKLLHDMIRKLEGADGYTPKKFNHHARHDGTGKIRVIATNHANITVIGGLSVDIKVGWKGLSHTFHVNLGGNNRVNYNTVIVPQTDIDGWDIYIDSETRGNHHYVGIDVNVASIILK